MSGLERDGYKEAFYEIADMLDIPARPLSPAVVFETEMKPRLREALGERAQIAAWHRSEAQRLHEAAAKEGQKPDPDERYFRHLVGCSTTHAACADAIERGDHLASLTTKQG